MIKSLPCHPSMTYTVTHSIPLPPYPAASIHLMHTESGDQDQKLLSPILHTDTLTHSIIFSLTSSHILAYLLSAREKDYKHKEASY